ncbi:hypothetical protein Q4561_10695 [Alteromonas sp. 1_MG-2023]|uniref:hypothetical protein n=1 Tax=Alteromonas sp. 1_MG-2023 TaxID=3062669 RepID=UPI0026E1C06E|nr:hypothetical protein [Alteromonas sp. 1_MG-2023]MDO6567525.1 hypothetical protein [Alteromonas sp. 1_MG-2023]
MKTFVSTNIITACSLQPNLQLKAKPKTSMQNLFNDLKAKTHSKHEALEQSPPFALFHNMMGLTANELINEHSHNYLKVLCVMQQFHQHCLLVIDEAVELYPSLQPLVSHFEDNNILTALDDDLACMSASEATFNNKLRDVNSPDFNTALSSAIAAMYVWLGSSMGANIITRRLEKAGTTFPTHYYKTMAQYAKVWPEFKLSVTSLLPQLIERNELTHTNTQDLADAIISDANLWFDYLIAVGKSTTLPSQTLS